MTFDPDTLVESWRSLQRLSKHTRLEVAHAVHAGHRPGETPPLADGDPVPGCACLRCTGTEVPTSTPKRNYGRDSLPVRESRRVPITDLAARLGLGKPVGRWGERRVLCPLHDDHNPSLRLDMDRGLWFCDVCGLGGDGIELVRRTLDLSFAEAVRWLAEGRVASSRDEAQRELAP